MLLVSRNTGNISERFRVIGDGSVDPPRRAASATAVDNAIRRRRALDANRLHSAATALGAIARLSIDMLAPETLRTVIGIAVAAHLMSAVFAGEIFYRSGEPHVYCNSTATDCCAIAPFAVVHESVKTICPTAEAALVAKMRVALFAVPILAGPC